MNILVLGCNGQLGVCLVKLLKLTEWTVFALNKNALNICDRINVALEFHKYKPDVIINVAAFTAVDKAEDNMSVASAVNYNGVINIATAANKMGVPLIHISTDYVFNGEKKSPYIESDPASPVNVYGATKHAGEMALMELMSQYLIIRTSWLFGECGDNFFTKINHLLQASSEFSVVDDQIGGPTYVNDLVKLIVAVLKYYESHNILPWGIYHYAGHPFVSWFEFARAIQDIISPKNDCVIRPVSSSSYLSRAKRPSNSCLDSSKVQCMFGVPPSDWRYAIEVISGH